MGLRFRSGTVRAAGTSVKPGGRTRRRPIWTQLLQTTLRAPVPRRQVVLTIPNWLGASALYRRHLLGEIARVAVCTVGWVAMG